jgi:hypothetical protein
MCSTEKLYQDKRSHVLRCPRCNNYQVGIGTIALTVSAEQFCSLKAYIDDVCCNLAGATPQERFAIPTPSPAVNMILTAEELRHFACILDAAESEATALSLVRLFRA